MESLAEYHNPYSNVLAASSSSSLTGPSMVRTSSSDTNRVSKRKGARSVATLSSAQLARKRANDREAQRAIRARTKDHIERLEAEVEALKAGKTFDPEVEDLRRKNKYLEDECIRLQGAFGMHATPTSHPSSSPYEQNSMSSSSGAAVTSPRNSPFNDASMAGAKNTADSFPPPMGMYTSPVTRVNTNNTNNGWDASMMQSRVSSPDSSLPDEELTVSIPQYMPTSAPHTMMPSPSNSVPLVQDHVKLEYDDSSDPGYIDSSPVSIPGSPPTMVWPTNIFPHMSHLPSAAMSGHSFMHHHQPNSFNWAPHHMMYQQAI